MLKSLKQISVVSIIVILVMVPSTSLVVNVNAQQATGQTNILGTCGLSFPNGNNINYGSLVPNTISTEKILNLTNTGTVNALLKVRGGNWVDSGNNTIMEVDETHFNVTSGTYFQKTTLQSVDQTITNYFSPSTVLSTFWQLQTNLVNSLFTGSTIQTMNFTVTCAPIFFQDSYSSSAGWTQIGSTITVNDPLFPGIVKFNNVQGGAGVNEQRVYKQLPNTLPSDRWIIEFDYKFTASSIPGHYPLALTNTANDPGSTSPMSEEIRLVHGVDTDNLLLSTVGGVSAEVPISQNTKYYPSLERTPTQLILSVFSNPERTIHVTGSPVSVNLLVTDYDNLNFIQHSASLESGSGRILTAEVDNTTIFVFQ